MSNINTNFKTVGKGRKFLSPMSVDATVCVRKKCENIRSVKSDSSHVSSKSTVKRRRKHTGESKTECIDVGHIGNDVSCMRMIGIKLRKFLFLEANKVSKHASEYIVVLNKTSKHWRKKGRANTRERKDKRTTRND